MPHRFGRCPDCRHCIFQLKLVAGELLTPIFEFIRFVRIDSVIGERPSFGSDSRHNISPVSKCDKLFGLREKTAHNGYPQAAKQTKRLYQIAKRKDTGERAIPDADASILSRALSGQSG